MVTRIRETCWLVMLAALLPAGCLQAALDEWNALTAAEPSTGAATSSSTGAPEVDPTGGIQTVTSAGQTTGPGPGAVETTGEPGDENAPPEIKSFTVEPAHHEQAGKSEIALVATDDVVKVHLKLNGEPFAELTPADFPYTYEVLSAKQNFDHIFTVVVEDEEGLTDASEPVKMTVLVPETGAQKCIFPDELNEDVQAVSSWISGVVYADDAIVAVGTRDAGEGPRLTVWKFDRDGCGVLPGWPIPVGSWTKHTDVEKNMSGGTAVAVDEEGNIVVGGFSLVKLEPRRYIAMLSSTGARVWEKIGQVGEEIAGVAVAPKPKAAVFAVGWRRTGLDPTPTDAMIWHHMPDDGTPTPAEILVAPFTPDEPNPDTKNEFSEWAHAVTIESGTGYAFVVGEREFRDENNILHTRTFAARYNPLTGVIGDPWTSPGGSFFHDSADAVTVCGDKFLAAGWRRDDPPNALPAPLLQWFAPEGSPAGLRSLPLTPVRLHGIACDREGKLVGAGTRDGVLKDIQVFAVIDDALVWYDQGSAGDDEAVAVSCDRRGFCAWGGYRTKDGKRYAVVRAHHP